MEEMKVCVLDTTATGMGGGISGGGTVVVVGLRLLRNNDLG